jgi:hypothetical protein
MSLLETARFSLPTVAIPDQHLTTLHGVWRPDVEMPKPFDPHHLMMASLYTRGYTVPDIAQIIGRSPSYCANLFNDVYCPQSLPFIIHEATGYTPISTAQAVLWMGKHKFLEPIVEVPIVLVKGRNPFNQTHMDIMFEYMGGNTTQAGIAKKILVSEGTVRNYFSTAHRSIPSIVSRCTADRWIPPHALAAGYWMMTHGYIPPDVMGEQLP